MIIFKVLVTLLEIHACSDPSPCRKVLLSATVHRQLQATEFN